MIHRGLLVGRFARAAALLFLFTLGAPALRDGGGAPIAQAQEKKLTIAFLRPGPDPYYQDGEKGAQSAAAALGATVQTYYSNVSQAQELANVEDAISKHVDGILMYAVSLSAESADVAKANAAHIPIFLLYGYSKALVPKVAGFEQVNLVPYGKEVGVWLGKHVKAGTGAVITGLLGRGDAEAYAQGFKDGVAASGSKLSIVAQLPGDWNRQKAYNAAQDLITAHPNLNAMFVENEDMAIGAIRALDHANKLSQVTVVSQNGAPYGLEAINAGKIAASNTCSPALEAVMGLRILVGVIKKQTQPGHLYYSLTKFVTKANTADANPWVPNDNDVKRFLGFPILTPVAAGELPA